MACQGVGGQGVSNTNREIKGIEYDDSIPSVLLHNTFKEKKNANITNAKLRQSFK